MDEAPARPSRLSARVAPPPAAEQPAVAVTRVVIVEDRRLLRGALIALLAKEQDVEVVAAVACDDRVIEMAMQYRAQVVVLDLELAGEQGLTAIRRLRARLPNCAVVVLAVGDRPGLLRRALDANVAGMVNKHASPWRLGETIRTVAAGKRGVDSQLAIAALYGATNPLTQREIDVLRLAADGAAPAEIAQRLSLSGGTVRNYLSRITGKVGARSRIDAIRIATNAGWL